MPDTVVQHSTTPADATAKPPFGFHHHSWVITDHARTRAFYEDMLGIPLIAFWVEHDNVAGDELVLGHAFYGLQDGSRLSFFNVQGEAMHEKFKSPKTQIFNHIAMHIDDETQARYKKALDAAGIFNFTLDHGYCHSLYTMDPDGLRLEFAVDDARAEAINAEQLANARGTMERWIAGDRPSNNHWAENRGDHDVR